MHIHHHGAVDGVTGSCHQLDLDDGRSLLIDCGLFQGHEQGPGGAGAERPHIEFPVAPIVALILTHVHIDHVGRLPHLLAAGYRGPILCSRASAELLPLVLEDALRIGVTRDARLIEQVLGRLRERTVALDYVQWYDLTDRRPIAAPGDAPAVRLQQAGHILGSAYVEIQASGERIVFSGDLGAPDTPLLPDPTPLERAEVLVLESTYGDRRHEDRASRVRRLRGRPARRSARDPAGARRGGRQAGAGRRTARAPAADARSGAGLKPHGRGL